MQCFYALAYSIDIVCSWLCQSSRVFVPSRRSEVFFAELPVLENLTANWKGNRTGIGRCTPFIKAIVDSGLRPGA